MITSFLSRRSSLLCDTDFSSETPGCFCLSLTEHQNLPIRPRYRSTPPCWLWTPSRSSTVDFLTLGKTKCFLTFSTFCNSHRYLRMSFCGATHSVFEQFHFDAIRCLQDAEVLLKLTEEVNATLRNKVSCFFFFSIPHVFILLNLQRCTYTHTASLSPSFQASVNTELVRCLSRTARGTLPPLAAAVGGLASQEVLKAITGKFAPLQQWVGH